MLTQHSKRLQVLAVAIWNAKKIVIYLHHKSSLYQEILNFTQNKANKMQNGKNSIIIRTIVNCVSRVYTGTKKKKNTQNSGSKVWNFTCNY